MTNIYLVMRAESYGTQQVYWKPIMAFTSKAAATQEAGRYGKVVPIPLQGIESREDEEGAAPSPRAEDVLRCMDCPAAYAEFPLDTTLPNEQWQMINPESGGVLCASCIVKRAAQIPGAIALRAFIELAERGSSAQAAAPSPRAEGSTEQEIEKLLATINYDYAGDSPVERVRTLVLDFQKRGDLLEAAVRKLRAGEPPEGTEPTGEGARTKP